MQDFSVRVSVRVAGDSICGEGENRKQPVPHRLAVLTVLGPRKGEIRDERGQEKRRLTYEICLLGGILLPKQCIESGYIGRGQISGNEKESHHFILQEAVYDPK